MSTTTIHVYNSITKPNQNEVLLFLQPCNASSTFLYSAWNVLNPSPLSYQSATLSTIFSASIAEFASSRGDYSRAVELPLGTAWTITDLNHQSAAITPVVSTQTQLTPTQVGLYNDAVTPDTDVSVVWYVNHKKVVETNNTATTTLDPGFTSIFELEQKVYVMFGQQPTVTTTYTAQTVGNQVSFAINPTMTDLYLVAYLGADGIATFKSVTQTEWDALVSAGNALYHDGRRHAAALGAAVPQANVGAPERHGLTDVSVMGLYTDPLLRNGVGWVDIDDGTVVELRCGTFGTLPKVGEQYVINATIHGFPSVQPPQVKYTLRCTVAGPISRFVP